MDSLIKYENFIKDLKLKAVFKSGLAGTEMFNGVRVRLPVHDLISDEVYACNNSSVSDYFFYEGERMCCLLGQIVSYSHDSILRQVQGYVDVARRAEIKNNVKSALDAYKVVEDMLSVKYFNIDIGFREKINVVAQSSFIDLLDLFYESIKHTLDCEFDKPSFEDFCTRNLLRYDMESNWNYAFFEKYFNLSDIWDNLVSEFNPSLLNRKLYEDGAREIAWRFKNCTLLKSGLRFGQVENWCHIDQWSTTQKVFNQEWEYKLPFLRNLIVCFKATGNIELVSAIYDFLNAEYIAGDSDNKQGIGIKIYKEHYAITLPLPVRDIVLVYLNKYAPKTLAENVALNSKLEV